MTNFRKLEDIYNKCVFSFTRDRFYLELADAIKRNVSLKNFAARTIENGRILKDDNRIYIGTKLVRFIESDDSVGLYASLKSIVPKSDWLMLRAAEASNDVEGAIEHIGNVVSFRIRQLVLKILTVLSLLVVMFLSGAISYLTSDTLQKITESNPNIKFDGFNLFALSLANVIMDYWPLFLATLVGTGCLLYYYSSRYIGALRARIDEMPLFHLYRDLQSANAIATLSMFLSSGLVLKKAIINLSSEDNRWTKWQVQKITTSLDAQPNELTRAFSRGLFSKELRARLASLSDSSADFEDAIIKLGKDELQKIEKQLRSTVIYAGATASLLLSSVAIVLALGSQTIITFVYNSSSTGF